MGAANAGKRKFMSNSPLLDLPFIEAAQAQKHVTHNEAVRGLDALVQLSVIDRDLSVPPTSPADGDRYLVAPSATGAWAGHDGKLAAWQDGAWQYFSAREGWLLWIADEDVLVAYDGSAFVSPPLQNVSLLGINTAADANNKLAVRSNQVLFTALNAADGGDGDMVATLNKEAAADDAGFTLQRGFSTRTLFGLLDGDDFTVKVSPDGSSFYTGISIDKDTGHVGLGGATADASNGLIAKGTAFLFDRATDDCNIVINKNAAVDDGSFTFQTNYSARALIGLLTDDNFTFKVTPDGSTFHTGLIIDKDDGMVSIPEHSKFSATSNFDNYIASNTWTKVQFNTTSHNDQGDFNAVNNRFDAPADGYYNFGVLINFKENATVPSFIAMKLYVGGVAVAHSEQRYTGAIVSLETSLGTHALLKLMAADQVDVQVYYATNDGYVEANSCVFWGCKIP